MKAIKLEPTLTPKRNATRQSNTVFAPVRSQALVAGHFLTYHRRLVKPPEGTCGSAEKLINLPKNKTKPKCHLMREAVITNHDISEILVVDQSEA